MAKTEQVNVRIEPEIKAAAEAVFAHLGMTPSQAITMFSKLFLPPRCFGSTWS